MNRLGRASRLRPSIALAAIVFAMSAGYANAQTAPAEAAADETTIVVTGSRILRPDVESAAPVTTVSSDLLTA
jgi:iron complex outermembrane recepter protein